MLSNFPINEGRRGKDARRFNFANIPILLSLLKYISANYCTLGPTGALNIKKMASGGDFTSSLVGWKLAP